MIEDSGISAEATFVANMKDMREALGWSQGEMARRLTDAGLDGFHQTTVSRIEKHERPVRLGEAVSIAEVLGRDVESMTVSLVPLEAELRAAASTQMEMLVTTQSHMRALAQLARAADAGEGESAAVRLMLESRLRDSSPARLAAMAGSLYWRDSSGGGSMGHYEKTLRGTMALDQAALNGSSGDEAQDGDDQ